MLYVPKHMQGGFAKKVAYNHLVEFQQKALISMAVFFPLCFLGKCMDISFINSIFVRVFHIKREIRDISQKSCLTNFLLMIFT